MPKQAGRKIVRSASSTGVSHITAADFVPSRRVRRTRSIKPSLPPLDVMPCSYTSSGSRSSASGVPLALYPGGEVSGRVKTRRNARGIRIAAHASGYQLLCSIMDAAIGDASICAIISVDDSFMKASALCESQTSLMNPGVGWEEPHRRSPGHRSAATAKNSVGPSWIPPPMASSKGAVHTSRSGNMFGKRPARVSVPNQPVAATTGCITYRLDPHICQACTEEK